MRPIGLTLRALREESGLSQIEVAEWMSGHYKPTKSKAVSAWERGDAMLNAEQLLSLCELYHVDDVRAAFLGRAGLNAEGLRKLREYEALLKESGRYAEALAPVPLRTLPLYEIPVSAGTGQFLDSDNYELIEVDAIVPLSADVGVRVRGDSMVPRFADGQVVWVHEQPAIENGEFGVFYHDGEAYIKKFVREGGGVSLVSLNQAYAPIDVTGSDDLRVFGRVVG